MVNPHAWQPISNAKIYVANICDGLNNADPAARTSTMPTRDNAVDTEGDQESGSAK
jgi:hypothetical protein